MGVLNGMEDAIEKKYGQDNEKVFGEGVGPCNRGSHGGMPRQAAHGLYGELYHGRPRQQTYNSEQGRSSIWASWTQSIGGTTPFSVSWAKPQESLALLRL